MIGAHAAIDASAQCFPASSKGPGEDWITPQIEIVDNEHLRFNSAGPTRAWRQVPEKCRHVCETIRPPGHYFSASPAS